MGCGGVCVWGGGGCPPEYLSLMCASAYRNLPIGNSKADKSHVPFRIPMQNRPFRFMCPSHYSSEYIQETVSGNI